MFAVKPPQRCYVAATTDKAVQYESIQTLGDLKDAIVSNLSVVFGFTVYESFESQAVAQTGVMPMPKYPVSPSSAATRCWRSATRTPKVKSSFVTRGDRRGATTATSTCRIST